MAGTLSGTVNGVIQGFGAGSIGGGTLYGQPVAQFPRTTSLTGTGALAGTTVAQRNSASGMASAGSLSSTQSQAYFPSGNLSSAGSLTETHTSQYYSLASAGLSSGGTLSATAVKVSAVVDSHGYGTVAGGTSATMTATYTHTFNATSNFILCVVGYYASGSISPPAPGTVTVGSTTMTLITSANVTLKPGTTNYLRMSWYQATGIAAGAQTVTASWTGLSTSVTHAAGIFGFGIVGGGSPTWGAGNTSGTTTSTSYTIASALNLTGKLTLAMGTVCPAGVGAHIGAVSSPLVGLDEDIMPYVAYRNSSAQIPYDSGTTGMSITYSAASAYCWSGSYITIS